MLTLKEVAQVAVEARRDKGAGSGRRLREIERILRRHRVFKGLSPDEATSLLEDLGPTFVKMGQIAANRSDVIPPAYAEAFKRLRADVPPLPYEEGGGRHRVGVRASVARDVLVHREEAARVGVHRAGAPCTHRVMRCGCRCLRGRPGRIAPLPLPLPLPMRTMPSRTCALRTPPPLLRLPASHTPTSLRGPALRTLPTPPRLPASPQELLLHALGLPLPPRAPPPSRRLAHGWR